MFLEKIFVGVLFLFLLVIFVNHFILKQKKGSRSFVVNQSYELFPIIAVVFILRTFIIEPYHVPSGSMYPTLEEGDFLAVNKFEYGLKAPITQGMLVSNGYPQRGDVIIFKYPKDESVNYTKRVIGLPGDTISSNGVILTINGTQLDYNDEGLYPGDSNDNYKGILKIKETLPSGISYSILQDERRSHIRRSFNLTVPDDKYFVMGDNRDYSSDSRYWGFVPKDNIKGKVFKIWMNYDDGIDSSRIWKGV